MKRLLLSGIAFATLVMSTRAGTIKKDKTSVSLYLAVDTSNVKGSFNELFLNSVTGSNGARLNAHAVSYVQDFMLKNKKEMDVLKSWGHNYFNIMDGILNEYALPTELKYLAVIESQLKPTAVSWAGAAGPWQLMPSTARLLGLKVGHKIDERKDYRKSTRAAAKYLKGLYSEYGDWLLVIAAYNGGEANVNRAIKKSQSRNFWNLQYYLPSESRNHVKKFIGTEYSFEGQGSVTTLTREEAGDQLSGSSMYVFARKINRDEEAMAKTMTVSGKYFSTVISKYIQMDIDEFNRYNHDFDKVMGGENNCYDLKLPEDKMDLFVSNKYQILNESVQQLQLNEEDNN